MSRTHKDLPYKIKYPHDRWTDRVRIEGTTEHGHYYIDLPTTKLKKRKRQDVEYHWMTTPMWFVRDFMNRPQRRQNKLWEAKLRNKNLESWHLSNGCVKISWDNEDKIWLESLDTPNISRKPFKYYW